MEAAGSSPGPSRFVYAETPVSDVHVSIEGLRGGLRSAALAAAETAKGARTLKSLDQRLRGAAASFAGMPEGDSVEIEVSPGPQKGLINVAFRQRAGWGMAVESGLGGAHLDPTLNLKVEQVTSAEGGRLPWRLGLAGLLGLGREAGTASVQVAPFRTPALGSSVSTAFEFATSGANLLRFNGPGMRGQLGAVSFSSPSGEHSIRFEAAHRELLPTEGSSDAVLAGPLRSTKTSVSYRVLHDERQEGEDRLGQLRRGTFELAGLLGDVALAKADCLWGYSRRLLGGTWSVSAALGLAVPLADKEATIPWEDRFFLGGALGGPSERLPGFASCGVGPTDTRKAAGNSAALPGQLRQVFRFGKDFQTETGMAAAPEAPPAHEVALDHIGGDARASVEAKMQWPVYVPLAGGIHLQWLIFGAAGSLVGRVRPQLAQDLAEGLRASVGAGIGAPLPGGGFLGVTCAHPVVSKPGDTQQRLQLWLSLGSML